MAKNFAYCEYQRKAHFRNLRWDKSASPRQSSGMAKAPWYLKEWRKHRGWTLEQFAERADTSAGYTSDLEKGKRRFNGDLIDRFSQALQIEPQDLFKHPTRSPDRPIMIIGNVSAGAEGFWEDDYAIGAGEPLDALDPSEHIALRVEGDSMVPRFNPGEILVFGTARDPLSLIGRECMVKLKADKRKLVKILRRGSKPGLWDLHSVNTNHAPIEDVALDWALPFVALRA
jgi:transcriptional regulator with XRE-family HTH domain